MQNKNIHWHRLRSCAMTDAERAAFFQHLHNLGTHAHVKPYMLKLLLDQIEEDMNLRREERTRQQ